MNGNQFFPPPAPPRPPRQRLELTPLVWIVIAVIVLIGWRRGTGLRELDPSRQGPLVVVRSTQPWYQLSRLGIRLRLPERWSCLSTTDPALAEELTFVNEATSSIVVLRPYAFESWPPVDRPVQRSKHGPHQIEWIVADHRLVGRLKTDEVDLVLLVMTHLRPVGLNPSVEEFCAAIAPLGG